jgi:hypothetical protein
MITKLCESCFVCKCDHPHQNCRSCSRNEKHLPLKIVVTSTTKKLKSGTGKSRSISWRGMASNLNRCKIKVRGQILKQEEKSNFIILLY